MSAALTTGDIIDGKYQLEKPLGRGGMGAVFRARHLVIGRKVAIKWLLEDDQKRRRRFLREAQAMGRLMHPNVVQVLDVSEHDGAIYLVMEYLDGNPLAHYVKPNGIPAADAIRLVMPALSGIAAAHQSSILHRDLKPDNLFVCCDAHGEPYDTKVVDFGLAKAVAESRQRLTESGAIVGTPRYMSPEQLEEKNVDERTDVYAVGLILFELLTGEQPYRSKSLNALLLEILTADHPSPCAIREDIDEALGEVVRRAIARDPADRQRHIEDLARALEPFAPDVRFVPPPKILLSGQQVTMDTVPPHLSLEPVEAETLSALGAASLKAAPIPVEATRDTGVTPRPTPVSRYAETMDAAAYDTSRPSGVAVEPVARPSGEVVPARQDRTMAMLFGGSLLVLVVAGLAGWIWTRSLEAPVSPSAVESRAASLEIASPGRHDDAEDLPNAASDDDASDLTASTDDTTNDTTNDTSADGTSADDTGDTASADATRGADGDEEPASPRDAPDEAVAPVRAARVRPRERAHRRPRHDPAAEREPARDPVETRSGVSLQATEF